jgi:uncharacterized repeat protein (TIGR01451 family)
VADLSVSKVALLHGRPVFEVGAGEAFHYNITVTNKGVNPAPLVVVTDKLPYEVAYKGAVIYPAAPLNCKITQSGDLIYARFDLVAAGATRYINISVVAPGQAPTTLYNIVNLRYGNDPNDSNNRMTVETYIPLAGYDQEL